MKHLALVIAVACVPGCSESPVVMVSDVAEVVALEPGSTVFLLDGVLVGRDMLMKDFYDVVEVATKTIGDSENIYKVIPGYSEVFFPRSISGPKPASPDRALVTVRFTDRPHEEKLLHIWRRSQVWQVVEISQWQS